MGSLAKIRERSCACVEGLDHGAIIIFDERGWRSGRGSR